jgi:mannose-6-phosphate isomerase-like protein (cupin superfamily)
MGYKPSPRPTFDRPTALPFADVVRHTWGDGEAGHVDDWIYVSSGLLHTIVFGMEPGACFRHSEDFRTIFGADEVLHVLQGTFVLANPETGEVLRLEPGESAFFGKDTWHHGFSYGAEPVRVLEFFAPPPSTGASGPYARTKEYLPEERWRYGDDALIGALPGATPREGTMRVVRQADRSYRLEGEALVGLIASTQQLTVTSLRLVPGASSDHAVRGGDTLVFVESGALRVHVDWAGERDVLELGRWDAAYLPHGAGYSVEGVGAGPADALVGVAPAYLEGGPSRAQ